jgi:hypothetical protein
MTNKSRLPAERARAWRTMALEYYCAVMLTLACVRFQQELFQIMLDWYCSVRGGHVTNASVKYVAGRGRTLRKKGQPKLARRLPSNHNGRIRDEYANCGTYSHVNSVKLT